jgi:hypothetical protein
MQVVTHRRRTCKAVKPGTSVSCKSIKAGRSDGKTMPLPRITPGPGLSNAPPRSQASFESLFMGKNNGGVPSPTAASGGGSALGINTLSKVLVSMPSGRDSSSRRSRLGARSITPLGISHPSGGGSGGGDGKTPGRFPSRLSVLDHPAGVSADDFPRSSASNSGLPSVSMNSLGSFGRMRTQSTAGVPEDALGLQQSEPHAGMVREDEEALICEGAAMDRDTNDSSYHHGEGAHEDSYPPYRGPTSMPIRMMLAGGSSGGSGGAIGGGFFPAQMTSFPMSSHAAGSPRRPGPGPGAGYSAHSHSGTTTATTTATTTTTTTTIAGGGHKQRVVASSSQNLTSLFSCPEPDPLVDDSTEIAVMKGLDHPNVVKLYEVITHPSRDKLLMIMEYVEGGCVMEGGLSTKKVRVVCVCVCVQEWEGLQGKCGAHTHTHTHTHLHAHSHTHALLSHSSPPLSLSLILPALSPSLAGSAQGGCGPKVFPRRAPGPGVPALQQHRARGPQGAVSQRVFNT